MAAEVGFISFSATCSSLRVPHKKQLRKGNEKPSTIKIKEILTLNKTKEKHWQVEIESNLILENIVI